MLDLLSIFSRVISKEKKQTAYAKNEILEFSLKCTPKSVRAGHTSAVLFLTNYLQNGNLCEAESCFQSQRCPYFKNKVYYLAGSIQSRSLTKPCANETL